MAKEAGTEEDIQEEATATVVHTHHVVVPEEDTADTAMATKEEEDMGDMEDLTHLVVAVKPTVDTEVDMEEVMEEVTVVDTREKLTATVMITTVEEKSVHMHMSNAQTDTEETVKGITKRGVEPMKMEAQSLRGVKILEEEDTLVLHHRREKDPDPGLQAVKSFIAWLEHSAHQDYLIV